MKVCALISGGKDSFYSIIECTRLGHEVVCLANLHPPNDSGIDEMDSFCFQTVGHDVIEAYAQCLGLPLVRQELKGTALNQSLGYIETQGDEVEDLTLLLAKVQQEVPSVEAVSSGAILSNYQRLRVENVCMRLGLVSLAYLWQRSQAELLPEMVSSGVEAIVIKVASMGLKINMLGKTIGELHPVFERLNSQFDLHICGEGGEYETLTLDCPLFRYRIVPDEIETLVVDECDMAPVASLRLAKWHLEPKSEFMPLAVVLDAVALSSTVEVTESGAKSPPASVVLDEYGQSCGTAEWGVSEVSDSIQIPNLNPNPN